MYIPDRSDFQPSDETLAKWLSTRKPEIVIGGMQAPGFYSDTGNSSDTTWFVVGLLGECAGLVATIWAGVQNGGVFLAIAAIGVFMFMLCDYFFAVKLHRKKGIACKLNSLKLLETNSAKIVELNNKLRKGRLADVLLKAGIILIAIAKTVGILVLGLFSSVLLYIPFAVIYAIVAYVHLQHTGYFVAYVQTQSAINRDHRQLPSGNFQPGAPTKEVQTPSVLDNLPIRHSPHEIIELKQQPPTYSIKSKGVLTDEDIRALIANQKSENKVALFKACRQLQVENLLAE